MKVDNRPRTFIIETMVFYMSNDVQRHLDKTEPELTIFHRSNNVSAPQNNFVTEQISACLLVPVTMLGILGTYVGKTVLPSRTHLTLPKDTVGDYHNPHLCCAVTCHLMVFRSTVDYGKEGSLLSYTNPSS